ncbi:MAG: ferredoxin [Desulfobacterales bacterium]|jgi:ferredoxin|nr:ferredoxin [Desulfobacterales bacterium]MDZ7598982.1 ferredoxin [Desulfobacterales bacterium]
MQRPVVELSECILCELCAEVCPAVFRLNSLGYIEVLDLASYPQEEVDEVIKHCPADCIHWEED